jgi:hypothetical protein
MKIKFVAGLLDLRLRIAMQASPSLLTFYTFTSPFAGTIRATPPPTQPSAIPGLRGMSLLQSNSCWGQDHEWLRGKRTLAIDCASRRRNQSWPWPPTPCCRADQEPNLLKEIQLPNNEKISTNTTLSVLL